MTKLFLRAALLGCAAAGLASAQTTTPPSALLAPPLSVPVPVPSPATHAVPPPPFETVLKTFDVADLVCPPADSPLAKPGTDPAMIAAAKAFTDVRTEQLLKALRACDALNTPIRVEFTTDGKTLVVSGPEATADKIGECVTAIRALGRSMVRVEIVVFTVPSANEAMVKVFGGKPTAAVTPDEFNKLLRELKASGAVDILSCPTLVVANRQTGFFQVGQAVPAAGCATACDPLGITTRVMPVLSADLKSVVLDMDLSHTRPTNGKSGTDCQRTHTSMVVPDGGTMAVKVGTRAVERRVEMKVPVVGDVPYLGRLFNSIGISTEATDTVAVVTVTRVADAPSVALVPLMLPEAVVPYATPRPQPIRTVGADGLERVGVNFTTLTKPATLPPTPTRGYVIAPAGVTLTRFAPADVVVAGGVIGATLNNETAALMAAYKAACAAGRTDDATRLGLQLLAKDPTCFGK